MKKYLLLFSVSLMGVSAGQASALSAAEQLQATKAVFVADFHKMDDNKDGKLSLEEYLSYQFENFRANIIEAEGFDSSLPDKNLSTPKASAITPPANKEKESRDELSSLNDVNNALQEMANYELDFGDDFAFDDMSDFDGEPQKLTKEDVLPEVDVLSSKNAEVAEDISAKETLEFLTADEESSHNEARELALPAELDLSVSEDENLKDLLTEINETPEEKAAKAAAAEAAIKAKADAEAAAEQAKAAAVERERQIGVMLDTIRKTLPKKIDEATTWTDIEYKDKAIAYIYEADIDVGTMSVSEKNALQNSIKTEACGKAYQEMCPRLKPMFINDGINVRIRYLDKNKKEFGMCEFNKETCV